ncbi:hypothetical protein M9458_050313, partial [Cirrhinus mrigala]
KTSYPASFGSTSCEERQMSGSDTFVRCSGPAPLTAARSFALNSRMTRFSPNIREQTAATDLIKPARSWFR